MKSISDIMKLHKKAIENGEDVITFVMRTEKIIGEETGYNEFKRHLEHVKMYLNDVCKLRAGTNVPSVLQCIENEMNSLLSVNVDWYELERLKPYSPKNFKRDRAEFVKIASTYRLMKKYLKLMMNLSPCEVDVENSVLPDVDAIIISEFYDKAFYLEPVDIEKIVDKVFAALEGFPTGCKNFHDSKIYYSLYARLLEEIGCRRSAKTMQSVARIFEFLEQPREYVKKIIKKEFGMDPDTYNSIIEKL